MSETTDGPGTAAYRLRWLLDELERRYPNPEPFRSDIGPEEHYIRAIDAARARHIREAVEGLPDAWISGAVHRYLRGTVYADSAAEFRADLIAALTWEGK